LGQAAKVDLSKVQQAMLTMIVVGIYVAAFLEALKGGAWLVLPQLRGRCGAAAGDQPCRVSCLQGDA